MNIDRTAGTCYQCTDFILRMGVVFSGSEIDVAMFYA